MISSRKVARTPAIQKVIGILAAEYLRFVYLTSRTTTLPSDIYERVAPDMPVIIAMWHGQHFLAPFIKRDGLKGKTLISRHRDGEINAIAAERLGVQTIRGSGANGGEFTKKGGVTAYVQALEALATGYNVAMTADVPKLARVVGPGIVRLARDSGRKVYPIAIASSRRRTLNNWDRSSVNLPFSHIVGVAGDPIFVSRDAEGSRLETIRMVLQNSLNAITKQAYAAADFSGTSRR